MNDEIKMIETETAKLKLQREQFAFQKELDRKQRVDAIIDFTGVVVGVLKSTIIFLLVAAIGVVIGMIIGFAVWFILAIITFHKTYANFDLMARLGASLGSMPETATWWIFLVTVICSVIATLWFYYD